MRDSEHPWPDVVRKLFGDIDHHRKLAKKKEHLWRQYNEAVKRQTDARKKRDDVLKRIGVFEGPKKVSLERKLTDRNSEVDKYERAVRDSYRKAVKAFRFSCTFQDHLGRLSARLPLSPIFRRYSRELDRLREGLTPESWLAETDPTIDAIKLRLTELLALAKNKPAAVAGSTSKKRAGASDTPGEPETPEQRATCRRNFVLPILDQLGWSIGKLATESAVGKATVYGYLDGSRKSIERDNRVALAQALRVGLTELPK